MRINYPSLKFCRSGVIAWLAAGMWGVVTAQTQNPGSKLPAETRATENARAAIPVGKYLEPILKPLAFDFEALGMIEAERRQYAENMAAFALQLVGSLGGNDRGRIGLVAQEHYDVARKLIGLAYHLDPRSRSVVVANGRLKSGVLGEKVIEAGMAKESFASLLVGRAAELRKMGGDDNLRLAGCFLDLAVAIDPASDDTIFASESFKLDGFKVDWSGILGGE